MFTFETLESPTQNPFARIFLFVRPYISLFQISLSIHQISQFTAATKVRTVDTSNPAHVDNSSGLANCDFYISRTTGQTLQEFMKIY